MKIVIYGAGAVGSLFGAYLSRKYDVALIGRKDHVNAINLHGLEIRGKTEGIFNIKAMENYDGGADVIFLTTKSYDTENAMKMLKDTIKNEIIISLQNGLDNIDIIKKYYDRKIAAGITTEGIIFESPGKIIHTGKGFTKLGNIKNVDRKILNDILDSLKYSGMNAEYSENIEMEIWKKGLVNGCINPLTAIMGIKNGELLKDPISRVFEKVCEEIQELAEYMNIHNDVLSMSKDVAINTADNYSSMLQDIMKGKRTEIDHITGIILLRAKNYKLEMKLNESLYYLVKYLEGKHDK